MSTLDQAFIRAYNKDRRAAANSAPNVAGADNTARQAVPNTTAQPAYPTAQANTATNAPAVAPSHEEAPTETGRWYRVDAAGNLHTRHQRMGEAAEHVHQSPTSTANTQSQADVVRTESSSGAMQSRHGGHRLPPYPHMTAANTNEPAETVSAVASHTGRRTLASYLAQNQTAPSPEAVASEAFMASPNDIPQIQVESPKHTPTQPIKNLAGSSTERMPSSSSVKTGVRVDAPAAAPAAAPASLRSAAPSQAVETKPLATVAAASSPVSDEKPARTISQEAARSTLKMPAVGHFKTTRTDRPAIQETETAKTKFAAAPFQAAWEVDSLTWPEIQSKLMSEQERAFSKVAAHFADACHQGLQVLLVTSPTEKEGRSTVASCIARSVAERGIQVALLDGDIESPALADSLNLEIAQGWNDAIVEGLPLEEIAIHSIEDSLTLIPLTANESSPKLAHIDRYIAAVLERLRESFDLIVIDATYINSLDNRLIGTESNETIDAMILVTDGRIEDQQRMETAIRRIKNMGISSVGIVENFTNS